MTTRTISAFSVLRAASVLLAALASSNAHAIVSRFNFPPAMSPIAHDIHWLHWMMLIICGVIFVVVFAVMFYSIWQHRKSKGVKPATWHESTKVEIAWTVVPFIIVIIMALPATKTVVAMKDTSNADLTVKATGYQWQWGYDYIRGEGEGISFLSELATPREQIDGNDPAARAAREANQLYLLEVTQPLVVPVDKKVRIITTANDVIHAWWVPAFGVKQDAIPGFARDAWFRAEKIGTFYGQCAELCGKDHAFMPIAVKVVSAEDYSKWVGERKKAMAVAADDVNKTWDLAELTARGAKIYAANCQVCHQPNGQGVAGAFPALAGSKLVLAPDKGDVINMVLNGKNAMPAWGKTMSDVEIAAAITFVENSFGNKTGAVIQPSQVKSLRK